MTAHTHSTFVEGCHRCDLSRDEVTPSDPTPAPGISEERLARLSVTDLGADPTGTRDSTTAVQALLDIQALLAEVRRLRQQVERVQESAERVADVAQRATPWVMGGTPGFAYCDVEPDE